MFRTAFIISALLSVTGCASVQGFFNPEPPAAPATKVAKGPAPKAVADLFEADAKPVAAPAAAAPAAPAPETKVATASGHSKLMMPVKLETIPSVPATPPSKKAKRK